MANDRDTGATRAGGTASTDDIRDTETIGYDRDPVVREETHVRDESAHQTVSVGDKRDRVRWGPIWAGVIVALPTFILLELALFALGWLDLGLEGGGGTTAASVVTAVLALFAFFLGGLTAGASAMWKGADDGLLTGIIVWALSIVGIIFLTLFGGGALLGPLAETVTQVSQLQQQVASADPNFQAGEAIDAARSAASWTVLGLGLTVIAAGLGGMVGAKMWPRHDENKTVDVR